MRKCTLCNAKCSESILTDYGNLGCVCVGCKQQAKE